MDKKWWKEGIAYQVYVRSFKDSNGDGIGDIKGIIEKLDYIKSLGIDIVYINPINKSPNYDNGYDISDYRDIMDEFGTLEDFDNLVKEIKNRDMKLIFDLVLNHTSHQHPWFIEAKKGKDNPYRDYYIWHKGKDGKEPCNWGSFFGGSVWEYDEASEEYYFHLFAPEQPDLNWRNENVRRDLKDVINFWIDKGIDGFRLDAINHLEKDFSFPDAKINEATGYGNGLKYVQNLPEVHEYLKELRREVFNRNDIVVIGETGSVNHENAFLYTGYDRNELDMIFHFDMHTLGSSQNAWEKGKIDLVKDIKEKMSGWQTRPNENGWCPLFFSNHDTTRTVSRLGDDKNYWKESAKMLATIQLTQKGTPFIYYGDEIGMTNAWDYEIEDYRDMAILRRFKEMVDNGHMSKENYLKGLRNSSRDNSRTPMQWENINNGGFTTANEGWIRVNPNFESINVENQIKEEDSILNYYKKLISVRKNNKVLIYGDFLELNKDNKQIYSYVRSLEHEKVLVVINFFGEESIFNMPKDICYENQELLISNYEVLDDNIKEIKLRPYEVRVYKI